MAALRSRRLEGLLGAPIESVEVGHLRGLVEAGVAEAYDLDFKAAQYGRGDSDKRSLCGDVAALANTAGGLVILGIEEDDQARATAAPGVEVSDAEVARIRQIVASGVSPLPQFDVISVEDRSLPGRGFLLIAVPRSVLAPHAVLLNDAMRFPTRNGSTTRYLSEPEVAAAYRTRLVSASERVGRLAQVGEPLRSRLDISEDPWVIVTLVPELPGDFAITRPVYAEFEATVRTTTLVPLDGVHEQLRRFDVGHECLRADDSIRSDIPSPWAFGTDLYTDGSGAFAVRLPNVRSGVEPSDPNTTFVSDEGLAAAIIFCLEFLAVHARDRAHASGTAAVRVSLVAPPRIGALGLGHRRGGFPSGWGRLVDTAEPVTTFAPVDELAEPGAGLISAAARLHQAIGHSFGLPELPQLTLDGEFDWRFWSHGRRPHVSAWAVSSGVTINNRPEDE